MNSPFHRSAIALVALFILGAGALTAAPEERRALPESVKALPVKRTLSVARVTPTHLAQQIEFQVSLKMRNFGKLSARTQAGERIPLAELEAAFLPLPEDYQALVDWAKAEHLVIVAKDPMRLGLFLSGTVAQVQQALQTQFARVTLEEGTFTSAVTAPSIPEKVAKQVLGINGLQPHVHPHRLVVQPQAQTAANPPYLVKEILTAYGAANLSFTGSGEKIAILIDTFPLDSDLVSFWSHNNVAQSLTNIEKVQVVSGILPTPSGEETLDVEWSSGIAPQARVRVYATTDLSFVNIDKGLQRIINELPGQPQLHQLSISLGLGETYVSTSQKQTDAQYFTTIASQGVSVFVSSGDSGANEGGILQVSYFASDPHVTAVGGTKLNLFSSDAVSSETGWTGSGGGISAFFARPSWQTGIGVPSGTKRVVPDVALVADPNTGAYVYLNGGAKQFGGTSWSAPTWAGFAALINEARKANGRAPLGFLNPQIYPLAGTTNFRDITAGSNGGYPSSSAFDLVTGLGVPQMNNLLPTLAGSGTTDPSITNFSPQVGSVGTSVLISGVNFDRATGVKFGNDSAGFAILSSNAVRATVPAGAHSGPISIITSNGTATSANSFTVAPPALNDNFSAAQGVNGPSGQVDSNNLAASKEPGEPNHAGNSGGASVWFNWTAPTTGTYTFATSGSSFDTLLGIYTGSTVSSLTTIVSSDDAGTSTGSIASFSAVMGTTYHIAVDGYNGARGSLSLIWAANSNAPVINSFSPQTGTAGTPVKITGANLLSVNSVKFGNVAAGYVVDSDTQITATVPAAAITGAITVTSAAGSATTSGNFVVVASASNNNFAGAAPISGTFGTVTGANAGATKEPGEPDHAGNPGGKSVWYSWTAAASGTFTFDTSGSSFDTLLGIYTGAAVDSLTEVASNDDAGSISTSSVSFNATGGTVYAIAVDGYNGASGNLVLNWAKNNSGPVVNSFTPSRGPVGTAVIISGANFTGASAVQFGAANATFTVDSASRISTTVPAGGVTAPITVTTPVGNGSSAGEFKVTPGPGNDAFVDRTVLSGASISVAGTNVGATLETGEPAHAGNPGGRSVWWSWTAPTDGSFAISTQGSAFDTLLGVYSGQAVDSLTPVASNDDDPAGGNTSVVAINAVAGTAYQIAVDGLNGASGAIALSIFAQGFSSTLYATGFEPAEGFTSGASLTGQNGWTSSGTGGNDLITGEPGMTGQQATVGKKAPNAGDTDLFVWRPVNYVPTGTQPIVKFAATMAIEDSVNNNYDDFQWRLYNRHGDPLLTIDFNNFDLSIYYQLQGQSSFTPTFHSFSNSTVYKLEVTMDFGRNVWSATLNGGTIVNAKPIRTGNVPLDFGNMDAVWKVHDADFPGDNYMVFDDLSIVAQQSPNPRITFPPVGKAAIGGDPVSFSVVATGLAPLSYQWMKNGVAIAGATTSSLNIPSVSVTDAGSYTVKVTNPIGSITSPPAVLTVKSAPMIVTPLADQVSAAGRTVTFKVAVIGTAPFKYQWFDDNGAISKATVPTLTLPNVQTGGHYSVTITNSLGSVDSGKVSLTVGASFASVGGLYNVGLASAGNGTNTGGLFSVMMSAAGGLTGTVSYGGQTWRLLGKFDNSGHWTKLVGHDFMGRAVTADLQAALFGTAGITGTLTIGDTQIPIAANRDPYDGKNSIAPQAGKYTFALSTAAGLPAGRGYASVTVDKLGKIRAAGKLGDYTVISLGANVDAGGAWPIYLALYGGKGYLAGVATFEPMANTDLDAALHWFKLPTLTGTYRAGFEGDVNLTGSAYLSQTGVSILPLDVAHQGKVTLSGGELVPAIAETIEIDTPNRVKILSGTAPFVLRLTTTTGLFSGTVTPHAGSPAMPYTGVVLQKTNTAAGVVKGTNATSLIEIVPATP
ncbi:MAG TPA: IPT/TIG domain-containing protein [Chthoniobacteraceae bacterium]|jgi:kumamolisin|nr:IPT/TIG domain-containing protein [Chthoniobacteraceae bacterium]